MQSIYSNAGGGDDDLYGNIGAGSSAETNPALMQEVKLFSSASKREHYDRLADLFAIVRSLELLENAYIKDSITDNEYVPACKKILSKYKTLLQQVESHLPRRDGEPSIGAFMEEYRMPSPAALIRIHSGVPASIEHGSSDSGASARQSAQHIAETVQILITLMDSLKLNMVAWDEIHPLLSDLLDSMNKVDTLGPDFEGKVKVKTWLTEQASMKASDELDEDQVRQLLFDLESTHSAFYRSLAHA